MLDIAMENNQLQPGVYKVLRPDGVIEDILIEDDDVNVDQDKDMDVKVPDGGIMSEEQFDALPPDVGNPPGTALSPSGKTRDDRNEWFAKYGKTHNRSGIKKTYAQYVSDMTPSRRRR